MLPYFFFFVIADRAKKSYSRGSFGRVGRVTGNKNFFGGSHRKAIIINGVLDFNL